MNLLSSQYIIDIINEEMNMPANSVWLRDQNPKIPIDNGLYIAVGIVSSRVMSAETRMVPYVPTTEVNWDEPGQTWDENPPQNWDQTYAVQTQVSEAVVQEMVQIDVFSRALTALQRNWEVVAALNSFYSQQQQEAQNFKIFRIPQNWINTSSAEGSSILNRYTITFPCFVWYRKEKVLTANGGDYYDDFTTRVDDSNTIGTDSPLIEFEINQEGIVT